MSTMASNRSLPNRLIFREMHNSWASSEGFNDVMIKTMSSLEWKEGQSQIVNLESSAEELIPIYSLCAAVQSPHLLVADEAGFLHTLKYWFTPNTRLPVPSSSLQITEKAALTSVKCLKDKVIVGTGSGAVCILDLNCEQLLFNFTAHLKAIKKVDSVDGDVIISCGKDNRICMFDLRVKAHNPVNIVQEAHSISNSTPTSARRKRKLQPERPEPGSLSTSVSDFVFLDDIHILSCGSSDGRLKEWDMRLSYKQLKNFHPVQTVEYPSSSNIKGYSCLKLSGTKLFASSVNHDIFKLDIRTMDHESTFRSPSKMTNYTKLDVSSDGNFLAVGSEEPQVSIFSCTNTQKMEEEDDFTRLPIEPFKCLNHNPIYSTSVCCPLFSPFDDLMLTTGGDTSTVAKWSPSIFLKSSRDLEKEAFKNDIENRT